MTDTKNTRKPTISVVVPVYNTPEALLLECLNSIVRQTYPSVELIIIDDGSDPETAEWLDEYAKNVETLRERERERATRSARFGAAHRQRRLECRA